MCRNCFPDGLPNAPVKAGCWGMPPASYIRFGISSHGKVAGEEAMKAEIYARGPIVCSIAADVRLAPPARGRGSESRIVAPTALRRPQLRGDSCNCM